MKKKWMLVVSLVLIFMLVAFIPGQAQDEQPPQPPVAPAPGEQLSLSPVEGAADPGIIAAPSGGGGGTMVKVFAYQGLIKKTGAPYTGTCNMRFKLYDQETEGNLLGTAEPEIVSVKNGLFTTYLYYPGVTFNGDYRYVEVQAACPLSAVYETLTPRQVIYATPYALGLVPGAVVSASKLDAPIFTAVNTNLTGTTVAIQAQTSSEVGISIAGFQTTYSLADLTTAGTFFKPGGLFGGKNGVIGISKTNSGYGVIGLGLDGTGIGAGVYGKSYSSNGKGVYGLHDSTSGTGYGVVAQSRSPDGWAGYFTSAGNGVSIYTPVGKVGLTVANGSKAAMVGTDQGDVLLYSEEATEVWFSDYGFGQLAAGTATIAIDPLFAQTVDLSLPYHVFVQAYGDAELYVSNRTAASFEVRAREGSADVEFSYRLVARRLGFADHRLEPAPAAAPAPDLGPSGLEAGGMQGMQGMQEAGQP